MTPFVSRFLVTLILALIQVVAAVPWLIVLSRLGLEPFQDRFWSTVRVLRFPVVRRIIYLVIAVAILPLITAGIRFGEGLEVVGKFYGAILQLQLTVDLVIGIFALLLWLFPKIGAVALAAFREGVRQPMFWLIVGLVVVFMIIIPFLPYFTFGEDYLMVKELGQDVMMLFTLIFGALLASMSISEEIEGRTAVTLMSKPVSRRQFLIGKFLGILLATLVMAGGLGWLFDWVLIGARWYTEVTPTPVPVAAQAFLHDYVKSPEGMAVLRGAIVWAVDSGETLPGLILGFCQVMVLLAISVSLATRLPVVANVVSCIVVYVLSHLTPILVQTTEYQAQTQLKTGGITPVTKLLLFVSHAFDWIFPSLQLTKPTLISDVPIAFGDLALYSASVFFYALIYTVLVLIFGLVLFEDRDLA
jgi:ABC-type transport system involved in multi-copper enzyme maturation permease subunit